MEEVIRCEDLTRILTGDVPVTLVDHANVSIHKGEFVAIAGPSGSGKSSLLYLLGLLDRPTQGRLWVDGKETSRYNDDELTAVRLTSLGFVFQFHFLLPEFTALENVMLPMKRLGKRSEKEMIEYAEELLCNLGLKEHMGKVPKKLSGGQSQRVAIARALANNPDIILADEPTGNLDSSASQNVQNILKQLAREYKHSVIVVTHDSEFAKTADRIITIIDGRIQ